MKTEMYEVHKLNQQDNWWFKARKEIVHSIIDKYIQGTNNNILEVGAGYGIMTEMLKEYGTVTAIEPYPDAAKYLGKALGIKTHKGTLDTFKTKEKYNIVAMFDVLEHIEEEGEAYIHLHEVLEDKGLLILTVPAYKFLWSEHDKLNNHYRRYSMQDLTFWINIVHDWFTVKKLTYFNTLLFPLALLDKLWFSKNKQSSALNPSKLVNTILYNIFKLEKILLSYINLPFGVSILLIAEKRN
jgi:SAM-dependent methyltransferase